MRMNVLVIALVGVIALPAVAAAHNRGHVFLPDGTCLEIGSAKEAPLVGKDKTQLDLVPGTPNPPRDEYGTSFGGYWGNTPILPGSWPATSPAASSLSTASYATTVQASTTSSRSTSGSSPTSFGPWMSLGPKRDR